MPRHERAHRFQVRLDRLPPEQVLDLNFPKARDAYPSGQDFEEPWNGAGRYARVHCRLYDVAHHRAWRGRHGDDDLADLFLSDNFSDLGKRPEHRQITQTLIVLIAIVVHKTNGTQAELGVGPQLLENHLSSGPRPDDQRPLGSLEVAAQTPRAERLEQQPREGEDADGQERIQGHDRDRHA